MKKQLLCILLIISMLVCNSAVAFASPAVPSDLPEAFISELKREDGTLDAFFDEMDPLILEYLLGYVGADVTLGDPIVDFVKYIYSSLKNTKTDVYALKFSTTEEENDKYENWYVDFNVATTKPTYALLLGNYQGFGTVPLGFVKLDPNQPARIMYDIFPGHPWYINYAEVLALKEFRCAAILATPDVVEAINRYAGASEANKNLVDLLKQYDVVPEAMFNNPTEWNTTLHLSLNLYAPTDRSYLNAYPVTEDFPFHYGDQPSLPKTGEQTALPRTGDNSHPVLWAVLAVCALCGMTAISKKRKAA